jgi:hypothetical protein
MAGSPITAKKEANAASSSGKGKEKAWRPVSPDPVVANGRIQRNCQGVSELPSVFRLCGVWGILVVTAIAALLKTEVRGPVSAPDHSARDHREDGVYLWQGQWNAAVTDALESHSQDFSDLFLFTIELQEDDSRSFRQREATWNWDLLKQLRKPVHPTFRIHSIPDRAEAWTALEQVVLTRARELLEQAQTTGVEVASLHLDYDCPTSQLERYRRFLNALHSRPLGVPLSITALPTWMRQPNAFRELVAETEFYVLQVHGLDVPERIDEAMEICDPRRAAIWAQQASRIGHPFLIALPTYGYELFFDADGRFQQISAEGPAVRVPESLRKQTVLAEPAAMAKLVRTLGTGPRTAFQGLIWYRLPVAGDRLNWSWETLAAVRRGEIPTRRISAVAVAIDEHLWEIEVRNTGESDTGMPIAVTVSFEAAPIAFDGQSGFRPKLEPAQWQLFLQQLPSEAIKAPKLRPGEKRTIGWIRFEQPTTPHVSFDNAPLF